nr:hypothetical protein CFP56_78732 [Quercus suber]
MQSWGVPPTAFHLSTVSHRSARSVACQATPFRPLSFPLASEKHRYWMFLVGSLITVILPKSSLKASYFSSLPLVVYCSHLLAAEDLEVVESLCA